MKPSLIISGGQTGADQGALDGAQQVGIKTGGWMPKGYLTEAGPAPDLAARYGLQEHTSEKYPPRTKRNVAEANVTVWIGKTKIADDRGFACTMKAVHQLGRDSLVNPTPEELRQWVDAFNINILNVAGPRASKDPDAHRRAAALIVSAFGIVEAFK